MAKVNRVTNAQLFNTIRLACSPSFQSRINEMTANNMAEIGMLITASNFKAEFNEWLNEAVNRIGLVLIRDNVVENPLAGYVYGTMEYGDAIEELAVQVISAENYNQGTNGGSVDPFRISDPEVKALYHRVNSQRKYRATTKPDLVKRAFTGEGGISRLFMQITQQMINGANIDDWLSTKEVFHYYLSGNQDVPNKETQRIPVTPITDEATGKAFILSVKNQFSDMLLPSGCFNQMGIVRTSTPSEMTLFIRNKLANNIGVNVLASAFNRDDLDFTPEGTTRVKIMPVDDFGGTYPVDASGNRLYPIYTQYGMTTNTYSATKGGTTPVEVDHWVDPHENVYAILADDNFLLITRQLERMETIWNPDGLYWNEIYHRWSQYGYTGFFNNVYFEAEEAEPEITMLEWSVPSDATDPWVRGTERTVKIAGTHLSPMTVHFMHFSGENIPDGDVISAGSSEVQVASFTFPTPGPAPVEWEIALDNSPLKLSYTTA